jgi:hypothetical protein
MQKRPRTVVKTAKTAPVEWERGIHLDVRGADLIAQAEARIAWHKQNAETMAAELRAMSPKAEATKAVAEDWTQRSRRTDIARLMSAHEEHARFLTFVAKSLSRTRTYRVTLSDLTHFELAPRKMYI